MDKDEAELNYHTQNDYKTPQKSSTMIDCEKLLDKINQLTTKPENVSSTTKVSTSKESLKGVCPLKSRPFYHLRDLF